jgi:hypothetical protein
MVELLLKLSLILGYQPCHHYDDVTIFYNTKQRSSGEMVKWHGNTRHKCGVTSHTMAHKSSCE